VSGIIFSIANRGKPDIDVEQKGNPGFPTGSRCVRGSGIHQAKESKRTLDQQAIVAATIAASVHSALPDREDPVFFLSLDKPSALDL
jgi:hypothetical protein